MLSMSRPEMSSAATGSGGTGLGSETGVGGAGGPLVVSLAGGGGGVGRATGGGFFAHALPISSDQQRHTGQMSLRVIIISAQYSHEPVICDQWGNRLLPARVICVRPDPSR